MRSATTGHRRDIQALRAVAVLLVVVYHLWPTRLGGGFVGVDVFFVISGFLITGHLIREVERTGTIAVTAFWARRIRRLLPASFVVLVAALAATMLVLPRSVWSQTLVEIGASAVYAVNWVLAFTATDYLGAERAPSIVQHFWSLSVEEQFYVLWPLLIFGALAIARVANSRRSASPAPGQLRSAIAAALGLVVILSLVVSIVETIRDQPFAYFSTATRAWEFGLGGLVAALPALGSRLETASPRVRILVSWFGLAAIMGAAFIFDSDTAFPGFTALLPVIGAVAVIIAGPVSGSLSPMTVGGLRPVQVLGDLSYSIYLWHWPLIVLYPYVMNRQIGLVSGLVIAGIAIALAWLTKRYVEDPVREGAYWASGRARSFLFAATGAAVIGGLVASSLLVLSIQKQTYLDQVESALTSRAPCFGAGALAEGADCADPFAVPANLDVASAATDRGDLTNEDCLTKDTEGSVLKVCRLGSASDSSSGVALVGNSHARALASGLDEYAREMNWKITTMMRQSCLGVVTSSTAGSPSEDCLDWTEDVVSTLVSDETISTVVFQSYLYATPSQFTAEDLASYEENVRATWKRLTDAGKAIVVVSDVPGTRPEDAPTCILESGVKVDPCWRAREYGTTGNSLYATAESTPGIHTIDLDRYFCTGTTCHAAIGGVVVYYDAHHLTATYARTLAPYFGEQLADVVYSVD